MNNNLQSVEGYAAQLRELGVPVTHTYPWTPEASGLIYINFNLTIVVEIGRMAIVARVADNLFSAHEVEDIAALAYYTLRALDMPTNRINIG